jgi:hypothetical protein
MADIPITPAPPAETPLASTPSPLTGSAAFERQLDDLKPEAPPTAAPTPKTPPAKPSEAKAAPKEAKPAPVIAPKGKPAPVAPTLDWKTAPAEFRASHEKQRQEFEQAKTQSATELGKLNARLAELDKRKVLTVEQEAEYQKKDERIQQIESDLYSRDYRESPEFKDKFETPWKDKYSAALGEIKGLNVTFKENDEDKQRPATKADFDRVLESSTVTAARRVAKELFGEDADVALEYRAALRQIEDAGNKEVEAKREGWNQNKQGMVASMEANKAAGKTAYDEYTTLLSQKYPEHFAEDAANPEASTALKSGLEYVHSLGASVGSATPQEAAKSAAIVTMMAGSWSRNIVVIKQLRAQLEAKESELAKYRKSAPGGEEGVSGDAGAKPKGGGSDALALTVDKLPGT